MSPPISIPILLLLLSSSLSLTHASSFTPQHARAQLVPQQHEQQQQQQQQQPGFSKRVTYNGGWALGLPGASCPSDAPVACSTYGGNVNPMCCPSGQTCPENLRPYCCPTSADCGNVVKNVPVCANSTWNMYTTGSNQYFCCKPGQYGILPLSGYAGLCVPLDQPVASSLIATAASQVGGGAVVTQTVGGGNGGEGSTVLVTSTMGNGGVTTITTAVAGAATATTTGANSSSPPGTATITISKGAQIGIACAAGVIAIVAAFFIWRCCRSRSRRQTALLQNQNPYPNNSNNQGQMGNANGIGGGNEYAMGPAPMYTAPPHPQGVQHQGTYTVSPVQEYKSPALVGGNSFGHAGSPPPPSTGHNSGYFPPPQHLGQGQVGQGQGGQQYVGMGGRTPSPGLNSMHGRVEAMGSPVPEPVEAPNSWERGLR